jgi:hypothetical protein
VPAQAVHRINDKEPRTEACIAALRARGDDCGQGLDDSWTWGFAAGFNDALAATQPAAHKQAIAVLQKFSDVMKDAGNWPDTTLQLEALVECVADAHAALAAQAKQGGA